MILSLALIFAGWSMLLMFRDHGAVSRKKGPMQINLSPSLLKFTLISALTGVGTGMIVPYFNVYFSRVLHATSFETGLVFAGTDALMVLGFIITPHITARLGRARATTLTQLSS